MASLFRAGVVPLVLVLVAASAPARVTQVEIRSRTAVWENRFELLTGRLHYAVDPHNRFNRPIVDLDKAPVNAAGEVEFAADFALLRPRAGGNGNVLVEIPNRGTARVLSLVQGGAVADVPEQPADFGDGWLQRQGYAVAWIGWQWDIAAGAYKLYPPVAHGPGATPLRGLLRDDFTLAERRVRLPLGHLIQGRIGGTEYPVDDPADARNVLTVRAAPTAERHVIPRTEWRFGADRRSLEFPAGFVPGRIYELVYTVRDPVVCGLGFAAVRDFVAALKHGGTELGQEDRAYGMGISQCGRFLRHMLYQGFDADEEGRLAFDGIIAHVAGAGRGSFNHRFAQPSRDAEQMESFFYPTDLYPFTTEAGVMAGTTAEGLAPKVMLANTSHEYWGRAASLIQTDAQGTIDWPQPENVRAYFWPGEEHFPYVLPAVRGKGELEGQNRINPNPVRWLWRAMIANMDAWVRGVRPPPPTSVPTLRDGTLVPFERWHFPAIAGVNQPREVSLAWRLDFGPDWKQGIIDFQPPQVGLAFPVFVPQTDGDGNDEGGVRIPELAVPVATYTGWNLRAPEIGAPDRRLAFIGSYLPFPRTAADRARTHDPRPALAERYAGKDDYLKKYRTAVEALVRDHWALPEDVDALMARGAQEWDAAAD